MKTLVILTVAAIIILAASFAHATNTVCIDSQALVERITAECRETYAQKRFDALKDKDRAIAVCVKAHSYYQR
jgi:hypothetical protein